MRSPSVPDRVPPACHPQDISPKHEFAPGRSVAAACCAAVGTPATWGTGGSPGCAACARRLHTQTCNRDGQKKPRTVLNGMLDLAPEVRGSLSSFPTHRRQAGLGVPHPHVWQSRYSSLVGCLIWAVRGVIGTRPFRHSSPHALGISLLLILLTACGGGSESGSSNPPFYAVRYLFRLTVCAPSQLPQTRPHNAMRRCRASGLQLRSHMVREQRHREAQAAFSLRLPRPAP